MEVIKGRQESPPCRWLHSESAATGFLVAFYDDMLPTLGGLNRDHRRSNVTVVPDVSSTT
jgi:hypothetical protein